MKNIFRKLKEYSGLLSFALAAMIFIFGTIKDCSQKELIDELEYNKLAQDYRP